MSHDWGLCKDCKWWQIEPGANIAGTTMGLCIDEEIQPFALRVSGNSGCNRFMPGKPAHRRLQRKSTDGRTDALTGTKRFSWTFT